MRIEWTKEAAAELDDMLAYIANDSPSGARLVAERVLKAEHTIQVVLGAGRRDIETDTYDYSIPKTRIVLTYAIRDEVIWVIAVWHSSRDPASKPRRTA